jgi:hypothetical protein
VLFFGFGGLGPALAEGQFLFRVALGAGGSAVRLALGRQRALRMVLTLASAGGMSE